MILVSISSSYGSCDPRYLTTAPCVINLTTVYTHHTRHRTQDTRTPRFMISQLIAPHIALTAVADSDDSGRGQEAGCDQTQQRGPRYPHTHHIHADASVCGVHTSKVQCQAKLQQSLSRAGGSMAENTIVHGGYQARAPLPPASIACLLSLYLCSRVFRSTPPAQKLADNRPASCGGTARDKPRGVERF